MTFSRLATSLVALTLFVSPVLAEEQGQTAEDATQAVETVKAILPPAVKTLLADQRPLDQLSDKELGQRLRQARKFAALEGLSDDTRQALRDAAAAAQDELAQRQTVAQNSATGGEPASEPDAPDGGPAKTVLPIGTQVPDDALAYVADGRPAGDLSKSALRGRIAKGEELLTIEGLPKRLRNQIAEKLNADRDFHLSRPVVAPDDPDDPVDDPTGVDPTDHSLAAYFNLPEPIHAMSTRDLRARYELGERLLAGGNLTGGQRAKVENMQIAILFELKERKVEANDDGTGGGVTVPDDPAAGGLTQQDSAAIEFLSERADLRSMGIKELRDRVRTMRRFIQSGQLSPEIREAVRKRMVEERTELRNRLAVIEDGTPVEPVTPGFDQTAGKWVNDRRSPASLNDDELRLRINIFVSIVNDNRYSALDRANWNERLRYDRQELRARMLRERALREARLRKLNERIVIDQAPAPADDFDMAEANARELEDVLVARPRRQAERRYTIEDFERRPELRAAVPRIEIDTIRFGFNESFVREEEIDKLDKVAEIIERILIAHPGEVFLIEGHTDASGSDFYNLGLSRQRARAVMEALTTYYVIPARSIRTIGYGERFLKIPVPGPEAENRRVSVSRITDFLAEY